MIQGWQIALLIAYSFYQILDELTIVSSAGSPMFAGFITGLIMGDLKTGLLIGAGMQLTVLGVGTFGGASRIDGNSGALIATTFAISQNMNPEIALTTIAVPVAALGVYFDILGRMSNTYFVHRIDKHIDSHNYKGITRDYLMGMLPWGLSRALPVGIALIFGAPLVEKITSYMSSGFGKVIADGLAVSGKVLPALGFAILLRYLPAKRHFAYLLLGFTFTAVLMTAYSNISSLGAAVNGLNEKLGLSFTGLPMLAVALIGLGFALVEYNRSVSEGVVAPKVSNVEVDGEVEDDEL